LVNSKKLREESLKLKEMQVCFLANQTLFSEGDKKSKRIAIVEGEGSYLGELSTLLGVPRTATIRTLSQCEFIVVSGDRVNDFFDCSPALGLKLAHILADRLAKMNVGHVKLEQRLDALSAKLREANEKLERRDRQISQLVKRIEQIEQLRP